jgi:hypothetical protein
MDFSKLIDLAKESGIIHENFQMLEYKFADEMRKILRFADLVRQDEQIRQMQKMEELKHLIVKECIGCCESVGSIQASEAQDRWINGVNQCIEEIKYYFKL